MLISYNRKYLQYRSTLNWNREYGKFRHTLPVAVKHSIQSLKMNHYHFEREAGLSEFKLTYVEKKSLDKFDSLSKEIFITVYFDQSSNHFILLNHKNYINQLTYRLNVHKFRVL